ncbi:response regulator [Natronomonas sp. F2-12]|jgi:DNA-binding response OmpR family regulator|uniref:Response regulator n=2 Tax=Natronomonas aquatica TaxID=2841590 RepID=A0A9R1CRZ9_9EURY|nr:response regulator [Natronomonas aquatica]
MDSTNPERPDGSENRPNVLVVDDEREVADAYALRLKGLSDTETVYDGESALAHVEENPVDILLLDRHMPGPSGDEVLEVLTDRGFGGRIIMVTAIDPGFDVLDMPFDDYLCKPLEREDIRAAVDQQRLVLGYETLGDYFAAESTRAILRSELPADRRDSHSEYQAIERRTERLKRRATRLLDDPERLFEVFDGIDREGR